MTFSVIITAGGIGKRMGGELPKQFMPIEGKPLLFHTITRLYDYDPSLQFIVTLPEEWQAYWKELLSEYDFNIPHKVISGGEERFHSIKNALQSCDGSHVLVHDGVRPFVSDSTLDRCFEALKINTAVVPVVAVKESLRKVNSELSIAVPRSDYRVVQTPQCFEKSVLVAAYEQDYHGAITDDASLVEEMGVAIHCVEGNDDNIKITTPADLIFAAALLK